MDDIFPIRCLPIGFDYELPRIAVYYGELARKLKGTALLRYNRAFGTEMALQALLAFTRELFLHSRLPVLHAQLIEWLDRLLGNVPSFPSAKALRDRLDPAEMIRALRAVRESPESHRQAGYQFQTGAPAFFVG